MRIRLCSNSTKMRIRLCSVALVEQYDCSCVCVEGLAPHIRRVASFAERPSSGSEVVRGALALAFFLHGEKDRGK